MGVYNSCFRQGCKGIVWDKILAKWERQGGTERLCTEKGKRKFRDNVLGGWEGQGMNGECGRGTWVQGDRV